ncbi:MAG: TIGR04255 family protein [Bacteroidetes bacterium]|nr:TIGR04255 family protein [Bacteroidota bacterium]MCA0448007.1 TIGR04255 family protein [Bacteroidota bacterium]
MAYKKPALTEIYAELFFREDSFLENNQILSLAQKFIENGYPVTEFLNDPFPTNQFNEQSIIVSFQPAGQIPIRIRCWDSEKINLVQITQNRIVVNKVKKYLGWADMMGFLEKTFKLYQDSFDRPFPVDSVSLRTIDDFTFDVSERSIEDYLDTGSNYFPKFYSGFKGSFDYNCGLGFMNVDGFNKSLNINSRLDGSDLKVKMQIGLLRKLSENSNYQSVFIELHDQSFEIFESLLTPYTKNVVMGGEI